MMKKRCGILLLSIIVLLGAVPICGAVDYRITQITDNAVSDVNPQINDNGWVVWDGGDIYLYDGTSIISLSSGSHPQINNNGWVVWDGGSQIYLYDGSTITNISNHPYGNVSYPQINENGQVVWQYDDGSDIEVYFFDGTTVTNISASRPSYYDIYPQINDNGYVVWIDKSIFGSGGIALYDGSSVSTTGTYFGPDTPQINNNNHVVFTAALLEGGDQHVFFYDGSSITNIRDSVEALQVHDTYINNNDHVVWREGGFGFDSIFYWDGSSVQSFHKDNIGIPQINDNNMVVFSCDPKANAKTDIYAYDGSNLKNFSNRAGHDSAPQINENDAIVWEGQDGGDGDYEIFLAEPIGSATASSKDLQITIPGFGCFSVTIENVTPFDFTVSPSITWTGTAPADVSFTGGLVTVSAGGSQVVTMPCFTVGSNAPMGDYDFDILWTGTDSGGNPLEITTDPTLHLVSGSGVAVGGTAFMADKMGLLAPWIALTTLALLSAVVFVMRRFRELKK